MRLRALALSTIAVVTLGCSSGPEPIGADMSCEEMAAQWQSEKDTFDLLQKGVEQAQSAGRAGEDLVDGQQRAYDRMNQLLDERERRGCA